MGLLSDAATLLSWEFGWAIFGVWVLYQLYWPTRFHPSQPKLRGLFTDIYDELGEVKEMVLANITVIRAIVRTNHEIDHESVDKYLVENGVEPEDFIVKRDDRGDPPFGDDD